MFLTIYFILLQLGNIVGSGGSPECVCTIDMNQPCRGLKPKTQRKMAKLSPWVGLRGRAKLSSGLYVDIKTTCRNVHCSFLAKFLLSDA